MGCDSGRMGQRCANRLDSCEYEHSISFSEEAHNIEYTVLTCSLIMG